MINNMPQQDDHEAEVEKRIEDYVKTCAEATADGTIRGVIGFVNKNNVSFKSEGGGESDALLKFVDLLTSEMDKEGPGRFPLPESYKAYLENKLGSDRDNFQALYSFGYKDELVALVKIAAAAATAEYLEANREPVLKLIRKLRGVE